MSGDSPGPDAAARSDATIPPASPLLPWPTTVTHLGEKIAVGERIAARARDGEIIGIGSGSAAYMTLQAIGRRVAREGLRISVVASSYESDVAAGGLHLPRLRLGQVTPDWGVDGADEIDRGGRLLKGRGGAMFREKLLWSTCAAMMLAVDPSKHVDRLGSRFPIPIEVHPNAVELVARGVTELGSHSAALRTAAGKDGPVITESGFLILDAWFDTIAEGLGEKIKRIPGVLETGLFEGFHFEVVE